MNTTTAPPLLVNLDQTTLSFGSNVDQIHEERGFGGEELSAQYLVLIPIPRDKVEKCVARKGCGISS